MLIRQDGPTVMVWAPAKINLFLRILGQRPDGFHEIVTLIAAVNRYDTLTVTPHDSGDVTLQCRWMAAHPRSLSGGESSPGFDALPPPEQNLVHRALRLLRERSGCERGARVELVKRIPPASGLGGGSSDAAAALVAGNLAWRLGYSREALKQLAAELGSDAPFFVHERRGMQAALAVCRGRGERIESATGPAGLHLVIARPADGLSTAEVYQRYKVSPANAETGRAGGTRKASVETLLAALMAGRQREAASHFVNDLQRLAAEISPAIFLLSREFASLGPIVHQMSGSGSAYFGWFRHAAEARRAAGQLRHRGYPHVWHVQTI